MPYEHFKAYFSPSKDAEANVVGFIDRTKFSFDFAVFCLTSPEITAALVRAGSRGVRMRGVLCSKQYRTVPLMRTCAATVKAAGASIALAHMPGYMHDKYANSDALATLTGSYNWTEAAEKRNAENFVIIRKRNKYPVKSVDPVLKAYADNFETVLHSHGIALL